jgi:hypothetical protein
MSVRGPAAGHHLRVGERSERAGEITGNQVLYRRCPSDTSETVAGGIGRGGAATLRLD